MPTAEATELVSAKDSRYTSPPSAWTSVTASRSVTLKLTRSPFSGARPQRTSTPLSAEAGTNSTEVNDAVSDAAVAGLSIAKPGVTPDAARVSTTSVPAAGTSRSLVPAGTKLYAVVSWSMVGLVQSRVSVNVLTDSRASTSIGPAGGRLAKRNALVVPAIHTPSLPSLAHACREVVRSVSPGSSPALSSQVIEPRATSVEPAAAMLPWNRSTRWVNCAPGTAVPPDAAAVTVRPEPCGAASVARHVTRVRSPSSACTTSPFLMPVPVTVNWVAAAGTTPVMTEPAGREKAPPEVRCSVTVVAVTATTVASVDVAASFDCNIRTSSPREMPAVLSTLISVSPENALVSRVVALKSWADPLSRSGVAATTSPAAHDPGELAVTWKESAAAPSLTFHVPGMDGSARTTNAAGPPFSKNP